MQATNHKAIRTTTTAQTTYFRVDRLDSKKVKGSHQILQIPKQVEALLVWYRRKGIVRINTWTCDTRRRFQQRTYKQLCNKDRVHSPSNLGTSAVSGLSAPKTSMLSIKAFHPMMAWKSLEGKKRKKEPPRKSSIKQQRRKERKGRRRHGIRKEMVADEKTVHRS